MLSGGVELGSCEVVVKRFRLRFLLQEVDLVQGTTLIGRSPDCHVTIEDPLVSRQHARIVVDEHGATCEDLGSRNGVQVNGHPIRAIVKLVDRDRVRIGTQELVFCELREVQGQASKATGFLMRCARCDLPYPKELTACPSCGASDPVDEDTMTGELQALSEHSWTLQLLVEVLDKAVSLGRLHDAARTLQRIAAQIDERTAAGQMLELKQVEEVVGAAVRASIAAGDATWTAWGLRLYARAGFVPARSLTEQLSSLALVHRATLRPPVFEAIEAGRKVPAVRADDVARLEQLLAEMGDASHDPEADTTGVWSGPDKAGSRPAAR